MSRGRLRFGVATLLLQGGFLGIPVPSHAASGFDKSHLIWTVQGEPGSLFGYSVATAGDVNGDGFPDLIVGAPWHNGAAGDSCGAAFVFYGAAGGLATTAGWTVEGQQEGAGFGHAVASAGDVNGDGFGDVIVGSPGYHAGSSDPAGRIYVYLGSTQGLATSPILTATGQPLGPGQGLGTTLAAGDFNGDGYSDVVAGHQAYVSGAAAVYYGSPAGPSLANSWYGVPEGSFYGHSVAAGDVNGDGYDDLFITAEGNPVIPSEAVGYLGSATGLPPPQGDPPHPPPAFTFQHWSNVAFVGDVDGDGYGDLVTTEGEQFDADDIIAHALHRGSPSGPQAAGARSPIFDVLRGRLDPLGDVDGDGFPDAITQDDATFYFYRGSPSGFRTISDGMGTLAAKIAAAGDVNRDGYADIAVGDLDYDRASVYRGGTDWRFAVAADLALEAEALDATGILLKVSNRGPETARVFVRDLFPRTLSFPTWFCDSRSGDVASSCRFEEDQGNVESLLTIAPGASLQYHINFQFNNFYAFVPVANTPFLALPEWVEDPVSANNQATVRVGPSEEPLFADGFESGDLSAWSPTGAAGLAVLAAAALEGSYGLAVTVPSSGAAFVRNDAPNHEDAYHARFRLDPRGFGGRRSRLEGRIEEAVLFVGKDELSGSAPFEIVLRRSAEGLALEARAAVDGAAPATGVLRISDEPHVIEVGWLRASDTGSSDGMLVVRPDGHTGLNLAGLDNDDDVTSGIDFVEWGLSVPSDRPGSPPPGSVHLDSFASWRVLAHRPKTTRYDPPSPR
jgi:hypothetical protein